MFLRSETLRQSFFIFFQSHAEAMQNKLLFSHGNNYSKKTQRYTKNHRRNKAHDREQTDKEIHVQKLPGFVVI